MYLLITHFRSISIGEFVCLIEVESCLVGLERPSVSFSTLWSLIYRARDGEDASANRVFLRVGLARSPD